MEVRVGMSWNFGVKPARTTLSEEAMHSIISVITTYEFLLPGSKEGGGDRGGVEERRRHTTREISVDIVCF